MTTPTTPGTRVHVALHLNQSAQTLVQRRLAAQGLTAVFLSERELVHALPDVEWLLLGRPPRIDWSTARRLRLIHVAGTGVDPLFPAVGLSETVYVTNARGAHADAVRDHVLLLALALTRDLPRAFAQQQRREWKSYSTPSLAGQRWVVLGYGAIGQRVSHAANGLGVHVHAFARHPRTLPPALHNATSALHKTNTALPNANSALPSEATANLTPNGSFQLSTLEVLDSVLPTADAVVLCLPLTNETRGLFHPERVALLPSRAILLNVSRGGILDEAALLSRLEQGTLRGAGLDVFDNEPLPPSATHWACPRLVITPHTAGFTPDYLDPVLDALLEAMAAVKAGETPPRAVSSDLGY